MTFTQTKNPPQDADKAQNTRPYIMEHYGVWDIFFMKEGRSEAYQRRLGDIPNSIPYLRRLIQDIFSLNPTVFILFVLSQLWTSCQETVNMHFSSKILKAVSIILSMSLPCRHYDLEVIQIEYSLKGGVPDYHAVIYNLSLRLASGVVSAFLGWYG